MCDVAFSRRCSLRNWRGNGRNVNKARLERGTIRQYVFFLHRAARGNETMKRNSSDFLGNHSRGHFSAVLFDIELHASSTEDEKKGAAFSKRGRSKIQCRKSGRARRRHAETPAHLFSKFRHTPGPPPRNTRKRPRKGTPLSFSLSLSID